MLTSTWQSLRDDPKSGGNSATSIYDPGVQQPLAQTQASLMAKGTDGFTAPNFERGSSRGRYFCSVLEPRLPRAFRWLRISSGGVGVSATPLLCSGIRMPFQASPRPTGKTICAPSTGSGATQLAECFPAAVQEVLRPDTGRSTRMKSPPIPLLDRILTQSSAFTNAENPH